MRRATLLENLRVIELQQAFEQQRPLGPREAQRVAVQALGYVELAAQQGLLGQPRQAQQAGGPGLDWQRLQRLDEVLARRRHPPLQVQQPALLRLPARDQFALAIRRGLRGKPGHVLDARCRLFKASGEQQGGGDQADQVGAAQQQVSTLLLIQTQQQDGVALLEQLLETEMLQQTDRHLERFGLQCLVERSLPILLRDEPLAGLSMPGTTSVPAIVANQLRHGREHLQPVIGAAPGFDETPLLLQGAQPLPALARAEQMLAQAQVEARQVRQNTPGLCQFRRQAAEQFVMQVVEQDRRATTLQFVAAAPIAVLHGHPDARAPTCAALINPLAGVGTQLMGQLRDQLLDLAPVEGQFARRRFVQIVVEQQAWPIAVRSPPAGQPPGQRRAAGVQQAIEQGVQLGRRSTAIIVDKQPGRARQLCQAGQQLRLVLRLQPQRPGQGMTQLSRTLRHPMQRQPMHRAACRRLRQAFGEQRAFAAARRRTEQFHPRRRAQQRLRQARAIDMQGRQTRHRSRAIQTQRHGSHCNGPFYNCAATLVLCRGLVEKDSAG